MFAFFVMILIICICIYFSFIDSLVLPSLKRIAEITDENNKILLKKIEDIEKIVDELKKELKK